MDNSCHARKQRGSAFQDILPYVDDVPGPHGDEEVSRSAVFLQKSLDLSEGREVMGVCPKFFHFLRQVCRGDPERVSLPRRVDIREDQVVRVGQGCGKLMEECLRAGVGVGLEDAPYLLMRIMLLETLSKI